MLATDSLLFKTNYIETSSRDRFRDQLNKFDLPRDSAFKIFPRRKVWLSGNSSDSPGYTGWLGGEYDLYETGRIIDTEAFVTQAFQKKHTMMFKEGWDIESENDSNLRYIKRRLREIEYVSNTRFAKMLREAAYNLVAFHNAYILKIRRSNASSGNKRKYKGKGPQIDPIAGFFVIPSEAMECKCDEYGTIELYRQNMRGYFIEFDPRDIIHISYNKRTGYTMGAPPLESVKDDILALRKIEESVESLIYKILFPIIHVKVGTEKDPAKTLPDGVSEVAVATDLLRQLDDSGGIATSERVEVNIIGAESQALRIEAYLKYFKHRVYSGLGMSNLDFGDLENGGNTMGEFVQGMLTATVSAYQREVSEIFSEEVFIELLLESGRYEHPFQIAEEDRVSLKFGNIDLDGIIKKENHTINKANADLMTTNEARQELGHDPLEEEEHDQLHVRNIEKRNKGDDQKHDKAMAKLNAELVPPTTTTSVTKKATNGASTTTKHTKTGTIKGQNTKRQGSSGTAKSKTKPRNQHTKDWLITRTFLVLNNNGIANKEVALSKNIADYILWTGSHGLVDPSIEDSMGISDIRNKAEELTKELIINILDIKAMGLKHPIQENKKRDIVVSQTIDKAEQYVNNILYNK